MKRLPIVLLAVLSLALIAAAPMAAQNVVREPCTGEPDPFACNQYGDCYWILEVCIDGATYEVGIFYDPATKTPEEIAADALQYGTVLTVGACEPYVPYFPCIEVEYGDTLEGIAIQMFGGPRAAYNGGLLVCESAVGDWGQNCVRSATIPAGGLLRGMFVCPAPSPDTGFALWYMGH